VTRDEIVERVGQVVGLDDDGEPEEEVILFDGMEEAFLGVAERFSTEEHVHFAVYSYRKMVEILLNEDDEDDEDKMTTEDAIEYLEFNTVGLYAGPGTPAILRDMEEHL
jgi:hypothetical protein